MLSILIAITHLTLDMVDLEAAHPTLRLWRQLRCILDTMFDFSISEEWDHIWMVRWQASELVLGKAVTANELNWNVMTKMR